MGFLGRLVRREPASVPRGAQLLFGRTLQRDLVLHPDAVDPVSLPDVPDTPVANSAQ
jgi:hypothetical protein